MDINLTFKITFVDGGVDTQDISVPSDPRYPIEKQTMALITHMFSQYTEVGVLRRPNNGNKFLLICPSQIATIECDMPSIVLANANDVPPSIIV